MYASDSVINWAHDKASHRVSPFSTGKEQQSHHIPEQDKRPSVFNIGQVSSISFSIGLLTDFQNLVDCNLYIPTSHIKPIR